MIPRLVVTTALLLASLVGTGQAGAQGVEVVLEPTVGASASQGAPFHFRARISNPTDEALNIGVTFAVEPTDASAAPIHFNRWSGTIAPNASVTTRQQVVTSQWFPSIGLYLLTAQADAPVQTLEFKVTSPKVPLPMFENSTEALGLSTEHHELYPHCDSESAGAAWGDVDGDDDLDLYLPDNLSPSRLWIQTDGRFNDEAAIRGVDNANSYGIGANFVDYDNDGDQDLLVVNRKEDRLFRNDGTGHFEDVTAQAGLTESGPGSSASWADYDNDGWLDLYVTNWGTCNDTGGPRLTYGDDSLFHSNGDGTFTEVTELLERTGTTSGTGFQAAWFDYDNDGDVDLYLGNDYVGYQPRPNVLWRNDGSGEDGSWVFTNVSRESNTGVAMNTMGIALGDYDRDLDLDMGLSNIQESVLFRNEGDGTFIDVASRLGVARPYQRARDVAITWGMAFADFNNDGWEDLHVVGGSIGVHEPKPDALFVNQRAKRFLDLSAPAGVDDPQTGRGISLADYDRDGRMDVYVVNLGGEPYLYRNVTMRAGHWIEVDTVGTTSNRDGCGARIVARIDKETRLMRQVYCGSIGLAGGSDSTVHIGLGSAKRIPLLRVVWPSGTRQVLKNVAVDRLVTVVEPGNVSGER